MSVDEDRGPGKKRPDPRKRTGERRRREEGTKFVFFLEMCDITYTTSLVATRSLFSLHTYTHQTSYYWEVYRYGVRGLG